MTFPTAQNNEISPNFLVWKFCGNAKFPQNFRRIAQNSAENLTKLCEIPCSSVSIVNFEHAIAGWVDTEMIQLMSLWFLHFSFKI